MIIKPYKERVLLKLVKSETKKSVLQVPEENNQKAQLAEVVEVGSGLDAGTFEVSEKVLIAGTWVGDSVIDGDQEYKIVEIKDILARISLTNGSLN